MPTAPRKASGEGETRTSRLELMIGAEGLRALSRARVMVLGLGGVGGSCALTLARGGVGSLVLVDGDVVQESNINRQAVAFCSTIGRRKTDIAAAMIKDINPAVCVTTHDPFVLPADVEALMDGYAESLDYVVDAIDTITTKIELAAYADARGLPLVSSMGAANKTDPLRFSFADIYDTRACPMCRAVRKGCRSRGVRSLRVLYSNEPVRASAALGSMSYAPPIMGELLASWVIRSLCGIGDEGAAQAGTRSRCDADSAPAAFADRGKAQAVEGAEQSL